MTVVGAALNEPLWVRIARENSPKVADADIPPPREQESAWFVADCLRAARARGEDIPEPGDTIGELSLYGRAIDPKREVPRLGMVVIVNQPQSWIPANRESVAAKLPNTARSHAGFLVRSTHGQVYVLGEGAVRAFPKTAVASYRVVPVQAQAQGA